MKWNVAEARQNFTQLLREAEQEPQSIYKRDRFVAAVLDAETFASFQAWQKAQRASVAAALEDLAVICEEEDYRLELPERKNRPDPFDASPH